MGEVFCTSTEKGTTLPTSTRMGFGAASQAIDGWADPAFLPVLIKQLDNRREAVAVRIAWCTRPVVLGPTGILLCRMERGGVSAAARWGLRSRGPCLRELDLERGDLVRTERDRDAPVPDDRDLFLAVLE